MRFDHTDIYPTGVEDSDSELVTWVLETKGPKHGLSNVRTVLSEDSAYTAQGEEGWWSA